MTEKYKSYLNNCGYEPNSIDAYVSGLRRIEKLFQISIDEEYDADKCQRYIEKKEKLDAIDKSLNTYLKTYINYKNSLFSSNPIRIWKMSHGLKEINEENRKKLKEKGAISLHKNTKQMLGKGKSQFELFVEAEIGDYFYLCYSGFIILFGRIKGEAKPSDILGKEWYEREYDVIWESSNTTYYDGTKKWWAPNGNSTFCQVKENEHNLFEEIILKPYFNKTIEDVVEYDFSHQLPSTRENEKKIKGDNDLMNKNDTKNIILYGPPGTGKTYNSVTYALAIIEQGSTSKEAIDKIIETYPKYKDRLTKYKEYKEIGLINFVTFHQSYSYEEFIEGIKPVLKDKNGKDIDELRYAKEDGMFKKFCIENLDIFQKEAFFDIAINRFKDYLKQNGSKTTLTRATGTEFEIELSENDRLLVPHHGETEKPNSLTNDNIVKQLKSEVKKEDLNGGSKVVYDYIETLITYLKDNHYFDFNKVFIIDEINRGNISKIFGELITLIEDSKRAGGKEPMSVKLPYSPNEPAFSVPNNVYIIGTMNTADRSIAMMDTALRRRFQFIEMMPDIDVLALRDEKGIIKKNKNGEKEYVEVEGVNLGKMLEAINDRIEVLYDREHTIGHAYFCDLTNESKIADLATIFRNKIIPLLQEYFYDDYEKIRLVLGDNQKEDDLKKVKEKDEEYYSQYSFIKKKENAGKNLFGNNKDYDETVTYSINEYAFKEAESYLGIYPQSEEDEKNLDTDSSEAPAVEEQ